MKKKHPLSTVRAVTLLFSLVLVGVVLAVKVAYAATTITTHPDDLSVTVGSTATFSVVASGSGKLSYQWQAKNPSTGKWVNSTAETAKTSKLSIKTQVGHNGFQFRCVVRDESGAEKISNAASLTVRPSISIQPKSKNVKAGTTATFNVNATGKTKIRYQWQSKNPSTGKWVNSSNASAQTDSFSIETQIGHDGFQFRCVVTDGNNNQTISSVATLKVYLSIDDAFPDSDFHRYISIHVDTNKDGKLDKAEIDAVKEIDISAQYDYSAGYDEYYYDDYYYDDEYDDYRYQCNSLSGIECFTSLEKLYCDNNKIMSLDLSKNKALKILECTYNQLTTLDVSNNTALVVLSCCGNQLTTLNLSGNKNLQKVSCDRNQLSSISLNGASSLKKLYCFDNSLSSIDVAKNTKLEFLDCGANNLKSLNVSNNPNLLYLLCMNNKLEKLDVSNNTKLTALICFQNKISSLNLSNNLELQEISCGYNSFSKVDLRANNAIRFVDFRDDTMTFVFSNDVYNTYKNKGLRYCNADWDDYENDCYYSDEFETDKIRCYEIGLVTFFTTEAGTGDEGEIYGGCGCFVDVNGPIRADELGNHENYGILSYGDEKGFYTTVGLASFGSRTENVFRGDDSITIVTQPKDMTVGAGATVSFSVVANGSGLKYQWQARYAYGEENWKNLGNSGAKTSKISLLADNELHDYQYRCIISDSLGNETITHLATLKVLERPVITTQPKNQSVTVGSTAIFCVGASGGNLSYQWQTRNPATGQWTNSTNSSAKTSKLSITAQVGHNGYQFRCIIKGKNGKTVTSKEVTLTVCPGITSQPESVSVSVGSPAVFSVVVIGQKKLTYQWQFRKPGSGKWVNSTNATATKTSFIINTQNAHDGYQIRCVVTDGNGHRTASDIAVLSVK